MRRPILIYGSALFVALWCGCTSNDATTGSLNIYLADAPASFDAVNIVVTRVDVHQADADSSSGWVTVNSTPSTYNLLQLRNGETSIVAAAVLPAGRYTQIRLIIGTGSTVVVNGVPLALDVSSGSQTGVKLVHGFAIQANSTYEMTLDFDAERSVVVTGSGGYRLKPVIRVQANEVAGNIAGQLSPYSGSWLIWVVAGSDTINTVASTIDGSFQLVAVPQGIYPVHCRRQLPSVRDTVVSGVEVVARQTTSIGTITLP